MDFDRSLHIKNEEVLLYKESLSLILDDLKAPEFEVMSPSHMKLLTGD